MSKALIRDGTKSLMSTEYFPSGKILESLYKCGCVSLVSSKPCWHRTMKTWSRRHASKLPETDNCGGELLGFSIR